MFRLVAAFITLCSSALADGHTYEGVSSRTVGSCCAPNPVPFSGSEERPFVVGNVKVTSTDSHEDNMRIAIKSPAEGEYHFATVEIYNTLVYGPHLHERYEFAYKGTVVTVIPFEQKQSAPDTFKVIPPSGYIAVPPSLELLEGSGGEIIIYPELLG